MDPSTFSKPFCRTCATSDLLIELKLEVIVLIKELLTIHLTENAPKTICSTCEEKLLDFNRFKQHSLHVDRELTKCHRPLFKHEQTKEDYDYDESKYVEAIVKSDDDVKPIAEFKAKRKRVKTKKKGYTRKMLLDKFNIKLEEKLDDLIDSFPCTECSEEFPTKIYLNRHFKAVHPQSRPSVKCNQCELIFHYKYQLTRHVIKEHSKDSRRFTCPKCNKSARTKHALINHVKFVHTAHEPLKCTKCDKSLKHEYSFKMHMRLHEIDESERRIVCNICGIKVLNIGSHVATVHGKRPEHEKTYRCRFCTDTHFAQLVDLRAHQKTQHVAELQNKTYDVACTACGKLFPSRANLYQHMKSFHNDVRPHACSLCGKTFKKRSSVREHMRFHTDDRPFPCDTCDKRFRSKFKLQNHVRVHTGEKPFACDVCAKTFAQKSNLKTHMSVHVKGATTAVGLS